MVLVHLIAFTVSSGVPPGATDIAETEHASPVDQLKRSGRLSGSPPVRITCGTGAPNAARRSMSRTPSSALRSSGSRSTAADAG
jgi:hypothetical protein